MKRKDAHLERLLMFSFSDILNLLLLSIILKTDFVSDKIIMHNVKKKEMHK